MRFESYQDGPRPWTRTSTRLLVLLAVGACISLFFWVHPWFDVNEEANDASLYIHCAKSILAGEGYAYLGQPFTIRPPGFSLMIAPLIALRGVDFHALNLFVSLWGVACVCLFFAYAHRWLGAWLAFALAVLVWVTPGFQTLCNMALSDVPGGALILACLLVERWASKKPKLRREIVLGVAIGLSAYVRSVAILLVPAIACARFLAYRRARSAEKPLVFVRQRVVPFAVAAVLVLAPWSVRDSVQRVPPPNDQNYLWSYSTAMWHRDAGDPTSPRWTAGEILQRVPLRADSILSVLGTNFGSKDGSSTSLWFGIAVLACLVVGLVRRGEAGEFFAVGVVAVILVYFAFQGRLVLPVWTITLVAVADTLVWLLSKLLRPHVARTVVASLVALLAIGTGIVRYDGEARALRWRPRASWPITKAYSDAYEVIAKDLREALPPDAVVASAIGWHYSLFLDRPVYSLLFTAKRHGNEAAVEALIDKYGINTVVLSTSVGADILLLRYFRTKYGPGSGTEANLVFRVRG